MKAQEKFEKMDKPEVNTQVDKQKTKLECVFCKGTGVVKCFDFAENNDLPNGSYDLNTLIKEKGTYEACPDGCRVIN